MEFSLHKDPGIFRILSLGESTTYGEGVSWRQTYSRLLEDKLKKSGMNAQVINGGVRAWSSAQSVEFLKLNIGSLRPDMILFYHEINDYLPTTFRGIQMSGAGLTDLEMMDLTRRRKWLQSLTRRSRLLSRLKLWKAEFWQRMV